MAAGYNIYRGSGTTRQAAIEAIDYNTPVATAAAVSSKQFSQTLSPSTWYAYTIRAQSATDLEDLSTDQIVVFKTDADGNYVARPNEPYGLKATGIAGGKVKLEWLHSPEQQLAAAASFTIYYDNGTGIVDYTYANRLSSVAGTTFTSAALTAGKVYRFAVRARSAAGNEDQNENTVALAINTTAPAAVSGPTATVGF